MHILNYIIFYFNRIEYDRHKVIIVLNGTNLEFMQNSMFICDCFYMNICVFIHECLCVWFCVCHCLNMDI